MWGVYLQGKNHSYDANGFSCDLIGGTLDSSAGQIVDRVGVRMGLSFPAGAAMEQYAIKFSGKPKNRKPSVKGMHVNLSGLENLANSLFDETGDIGAVSAFVFRYIARALEELTLAHAEVYGQGPVLYAGGVMSCSLIRKYLSDKFDSAFAEPIFSSDNALGIAELSRRKFISEN